MRARMIIVILLSFFTLLVCNFSPLGGNCVDAFLSTCNFLKLNLHKIHNDNIVRSSNAKNQLSNDDFWEEEQRRVSNDNGKNNNNINEVAGGTDQKNSVVRQVIGYEGKCSEDNNKPNRMLHFCFIVHGYQGLSLDLSYMNMAVTKAATTSCGAGKRIIVHSVVSNEYKTSDGIKNGGQRVFEEIIDVIKRESATYYNDCPIGGCKDIKGNVTISMIGNSLGGLYARYAIMLIHDTFSDEDGNMFLHEANSIEACKLSFNVFCTTSSPHLGVSKHTYIPVPRFAEILIGNVMGTTGRDLFQINDLVKSMCTSSQFLIPLLAFRKRIAYTNTFRTDFPVPTETAAFLHPQSNYPHHYIEDSAHSDSSTAGIVASFQTFRMENSSFSAHANDSKDRSTNHDDLLTMSLSLDSLGWKKVFVDLRENLPALRFPNFITSLLSQRIVQRILGRSKSERIITKDGTNTDSLEEILTRARNGSVVESKALSSLFNPPVTRESTILHFPNAHDMICAFSRNRYGADVYRQGRPVMDAMAADIVNEILLLDPDSTE